MRDYTAYREQFEICKHGVFLNHAAKSPTLKVMVDSVQEYLYESSMGNHDLSKWLEKIEITRTLAATLISTQPANIALVNNVTMGANIVANGLNLKTGDNIVVPSNQFPANVYPWLNLKNRGIEIRNPKVPRNDLQYDQLFTNVDENTCLIAISLVEYDDGFRHNVKLISDFCLEHQILLFLDAVQGLGAIQFSVQETPVDFLAVSGHKWLLGPSGQGFLYIKDDLINNMYVVTKGWLSVQNPFDFHNYQQPYLTSAKQIEGGSSNLMGTIALGSSLELLLEIGMKNIEEQINELINYLAIKLLKKGYQINSYMEKNYQSGILSFQHQAFTSSELFEELTNNHIQVSERNGSIRVSPHFYNNLDDLDAFIAVLPA